MSRHPLRSFIDRALEPEWFDRDAMMPRRPSKSPGYHMRVPDGTPVHETMVAMNLAVALLIAGDGPEHWRLAGQIIDRVVQLQDADEASRTFGIWSWYLEEPLAQMDRPDHNWADFIGARLAHIVIEHAGKLEPNTVDRARASLARATRAIVKRDITPHYTNIAIMGAGVAASAGEALAMPEWCDYARRKLAGVEESVREHGSFTEYNSPTYLLIVVEECDRILQLVKDDAARASASRLLEVAWRCIADHWHPSTQQWGGPQSRAYSDRLKPSQLRRISRATGLTFDGQDDTAGDRPLEFGPLAEAHPCPANVVERFRRLPTPTVELRQRCLRSDDKEVPDRIATTWITDAACLGSFNRGHYWAQSRPLLGYSKIPGNDVAIFRARFLLNGRDFAAAHAVQDQRGPRVLSAAHFWLGAGSFHPFHPKSEDATYEIEDLRLRLQLVAPGARVERITDTRWQMRVADHVVHIHAPEVSFDGNSLNWEPTTLPDGVALDVVCVTGAPRQVCLRPVPMQLVFAVEVSEEDVSTNAPSPTVGATELNVWASWQVEGGNLEVRAPLRAVPMKW